MINILIADDNIYYAKILINLINNSINNVKIVNIATDGKEAMEQMNNHDNIDIILLDLKMPILNGLEIIQELSNDKKIKYKNSIMIISGDTDMLAEISCEDTIYNSINKTCSMSDIIEKINELVKFKEEKKNNYKLKSAIVEELQYIGYNFSHKGTIYLLDAINLIYNKKIEDELNLKRYIYPVLARKYNRPIQCIKSDIIKATDYMNIVCEAKKKREYFSFYDNTKATVKLVIYTILNKIHKELEKNIGK